MHAGNWENGIHFLLFSHWLLILIKYWCGGNNRFLYKIAFGQRIYITFSSFPRHGNRTPCPMSLLRWRAIWGRWGSRMAAIRLIWLLNCHLSTSFLLSGLKGWFAASPGFFFSRNLTNPGSKEELCVRKKLPPLHILMTHHLLERRYLLSHQ